MSRSSLPPLRPDEKAVLFRKETEPAYSGDYWDHMLPGTYVCRACGTPLYHSSSKFDSQCGWPSFDAEIPTAVIHQPDADGLRVEITCAYCKSHLGHVFTGEHHTPKNTRHCVNSMSMFFVPDGEPLPAIRDLKDIK